LTTSTAAFVSVSATPSSEAFPLSDSVFEFSSSFFETSISFSHFFLTSAVTKDGYSR
jgi:hypothetical protein